MDVERRGVDAEAAEDASDRRATDRSSPVDQRRSNASGLGSGTIACASSSSASVAPNSAETITTSLSELFPSSRALMKRATASNDASSRSTDPPILTTREGSPCEALLVERRDGRRVATCRRLQRDDTRRRHAPGAAGNVSV